MNNDKLVGAAIGVVTILAIEGLCVFVARQKWPSIRAYFAAAIDAQAMGQLSKPEAIGWSVPASAFIRGLTGKGLDQLIHENLSLTVADGIGDALFIRPQP